MVDVYPQGSFHNRWAADEPGPEDILSNLNFSTTMPGGFEQMSCVLTRKPDVDYNDLVEFSTITVYGVGGKVAWQGRLQSSPRTSGNQLAITPGAVGWQAALDDNNSARMIWIDIDMTHWQGQSAGRHAVSNAAGYIVTAPQVMTSPSGTPMLANVIPGPWSQLAIVESFYDGQGIPIWQLGYAWKLGKSVNSADANWNWVTFLTTDDLFTSTVNSGNLRAAGPGLAWLGDATLTRPWAAIQFYYSVAAGGSDNYEIDWTNLTVVGKHLLTLQGSLGYTPGAVGLFSSQIIKYAVQTWAPSLAVTKAGVSTIETTSFMIPHLVHLNPTTAGSIINDALQFEIDKDWWVDEGPTFNMASRANHGKDWRARVGPSGLQETGPDVNQLCNRVMVTYNDVSGTTRTVGPTGSGANTIDNSLADSDPTNPVNIAGLVRYPPTPLPNIGTSTPAAAIQVGKRYLSEIKQRSTAGQASIVGYIEDDRGIIHPAWEIRSGDRITFVDAHDPIPRRIIKTNYSHDSKTNQIDLDSPAQDLDATIARLGVSIAGLI